MMQQGLWHRITQRRVTDSIIFLAALVCLTCHVANSQDYDMDGPYPFDTFIATVDLPPEFPNLLSIRVTATKPVNTSATNHGPDSGIPAVFLLNGFKMKAAFYAPLAQRLASWGYLVMQYDTLPWQLVVNDKEELQVVPFLSDWMKTQTWGADVDPERMAVAGHSRGAKLAALHLAGASSLAPAAAYLVDPVDCTKYTPSGPDNPCALDLLKGQQKLLATTGASIRGQCNPTGVGFHSFFNLSGPGSWAFQLTGCGHMKFVEAGASLDRFFDLLCGGGATSRKEVARLTMAAMVAWFELHVQNKQVPDFLEWAQKRVDDGSFTFQQRPAQHSAAQHSTA